MHRNPPPGNRAGKKQRVGVLFAETLSPVRRGCRHRWRRFACWRCRSRPCPNTRSRASWPTTSPAILVLGPTRPTTPPIPSRLSNARRSGIIPSEIAPCHVAEIDARPPHLPVVAALTPSVEIPLRRLFCVEYARMRSGLAVFGDAKHWWARAKNLYARLPHPVEEAVMVFSGSKRLKRGHVAVVTHIVSPRQIIVDQANWQNKGEIDHATPVLDVSAKPMTGARCGYGTSPRAPSAAASMPSAALSPKNSRPPRAIEGLLLGLTPT